MRVGIDIRAIGYQRTGDETYTLQLIKALGKLDIENQYFLYTDVIKKEELVKIKKIISIKKDNFKIISVTPRSKIFWTMYSLPKRAKKDKLDILHVQYITPFFLTRKIKLITTVHDISFARYPEFINKLDRFIFKLLFKLSLKKADKIIAVSHFTKNEIIDIYNINTKKIKMIYNGGAAREFSQKITEENVLNFKRKYGIIKTYLLYLGTLQPRKNIPFLIKSFVALKVKYQNDEKIQGLSLVLRGNKKGHNYDTKIDRILKGIQKKYPKIFRDIKIIDYISNEELPLIFKGAEAFCFPSIYEGFGLPLLESMTVGTPVVFSSSSCFPEIAANAGIIYEADNYNDLVNKIKKLLSSNIIQKRIIDEGFRRAKFFSWEKNAQQTIDLYKNILNKKDNK